MTWVGAWTGGTASSGGGGGTSDTVPPAIAIVSLPAVAGDPIVLRVTDAAPGLAYLAVFAVLPGQAGEQVVYRRGAFKAPFAAGSAEAVVAGGLELTVYFGGGAWPAGTTFFTVDAVDGAGNAEGP